MRSRWRTLDRRLLRDVLAISSAVGFVGVSFGAIAVATGTPTWAIVAMSLCVFAGGSQFMAVGLLAAGSPVAAIVGGLLLNARHFPFGLAVADVLAGSWGRRLVGAHLMVDEAVAFALAQPDRPRRVQAYWLTGALLFTLWQLGTWLGVQLGSAVGDPARYGLDAAFPAALVALLLPRLRERAALRVALLGAGAALGISLLPQVAPQLAVPAGLPVLLSLIGLLAIGRAPDSAPTPGPADHALAPGAPADSAFGPSDVGAPSDIARPLDGAGPSDVAGVAGVAGVADVAGLSDVAGVARVEGGRR